jgi:hypothetical protein
LLIRLTILALGLTVSLGAGFAQAHDPRLDEALQALQKAEALVQAALDVTALPPNAEKKYDRRLERVLKIIERVMEQIQASADLADDARPQPQRRERSGEDRARCSAFDIALPPGPKFEPDAGNSRRMPLPKLTRRRFDSGRSSAIGGYGAGRSPDAIAIFPGCTPILRAQATSGRVCWFGWWCTLSGGALASGIAGAPPACVRAIAGLPRSGQGGQKHTRVAGR